MKKTNLTEFDTKILLLTFVLLILVSFVSLYAFYANITDKKKYKASWLHPFSVYLARFVYSITLIISVYFLLFKNITPFLEIILILLLIKSIMFFFIVEKFYKFFGLGLTKKSKDNIKNIAKYDRIFSNIVTILICLFIFKNLIL